MILRGVSVNAIPIGEYSFYDVVVKSTVSIDRNIEGIEFPQKLEDSKSVVSNIIISAVKNCGFNSAIISDLDPWFRSTLAERMIYSRSYLLDENNYVSLSQFEPEWITVNENNHVSICASTPGLDLESMWNIVTKTDDKLELALDGKKWAFDSDLGYIMSEAAFCGTGLNAKVTVHVPALVQSGLIETALKRIMEAGFVVSGVYSTHESSSGSLFDIMLHKATRESEMSSISRLSIAVETIAEYERRVRKQMLLHSPWDIIDTVGRAYGRALGARIVSRDESSDIISGLRLGLSCDILTGSKLETISDMWARLNIRAESFNDLPKEKRENKPETAWRADRLRAIATNIKFSERYENV